MSVSESRAIERSTAAGDLPAGEISAQLMALVAGLLVLAGGLLLRIDDGEVQLNGRALPSVCWVRATPVGACPGCGLTRSVVSFLQLRWSESLSFHPAGFLVALLAIGQIPYRVVRLLRKDGSGRPGWIPVMGHGLLVFILGISIVQWIWGLMF